MKVMVDVAVTAQHDEGNAIVRQKDAFCSRPRWAAALWLHTAAAFGIFGSRQALRLLDVVAAVATLPVWESATADAEAAVAQGGSEGTVKFGLKHFLLLKPSRDVLLSQGLSVLNHEL